MERELVEEIGNMTGVFLSETGGPVFLFGMFCNT